MPETAASPSLPTVTLTVLSVAKVVVPPSVAVTVTVVAPAPSPTLAGLTPSVAVVAASSSSVMVPVPVEGEPRVALVGEARATTNVSSGSSMTSSVVCTSTFAVVEPAAMVAVRAVVTAV